MNGGGSRGRTAGAVLIIAAFTLVAHAQVLPPADPGPGSRGPESLAGVARLYRDSALSFSCREEITSRSIRKKDYAFQYVYVFDDRKGFMDHRTRPADRKGREVDPGEYKIPQFLRQAYSWAFLFDAASAGQHRFQRGGDDEILGRPAVRLKFEPADQAAIGSQSWFGTAWIDRESCQILKVEAQKPEHHARRLEFEAEIPRAAEHRESNSRRIYLIERVTTEFTVVKNGMRFPGRVESDLKRYVVPGEGRTQPFRTEPIYNVEQVYSDYRFFGVRTAEEIRAFGRPYD
jgi:hypothetical protein